MSLDAITVDVLQIHDVAPTIREFTLAATCGELPAFSPGSHVVVAMEGEDKTYRNAYSLLSPSSDTSAYKIAVRLQDESRGGSQFMHTQVSVGDQLSISPPANLFAPHWRAKKHILVAGGVGITPFLSYLPELQRRGANFELHYLYRSSQTGAYREELSESLGNQFFHYDSINGERCDIAALMAERHSGTHIYICGPESLIKTVKEVAKRSGWPGSHIHYEEFAAPKPGKPFTAELSQSGKTIDVPGDTSLLEALEQADVPIPNLCRGGVCGQCITPVVDGNIEHRDQFLSDAEKAGQRCVMPCVSRASGDRLVLDI